MEEKPLTKEEYNLIEVSYCKDCLSLNIMCEVYKGEDGELSQMRDTFSDLCDDCGSTDIGQTTIDKWEVLWKLKYPERELPREKVLYNYRKY